MDELLYKLALSKVEGIGPIKYRKLLESFGSAESIFKEKFKHLNAVSGVNRNNCLAIKNFKDFHLIEEELRFTQKNNIQILDRDHVNYPNRLNECIDAPPFLFYKGNADLNHARIISIIGTRKFTEYGRQVCDELIEELKNYDIIICSGLAFGIDAITHKACLKSGIPTIGVVAHGLDTIYPIEHSHLSREMLEKGGLLSEYFSGSNADKGNFPARNRIVAGLSDATVIIETEIKGGSMITAEIAFSYNRDVLCIPGRVGDIKSSGCNHLIKILKGQLITNAEDIASNLGWIKPKVPKQMQRELFLDLNENEQKIIDLLNINQQMHIDEFYNLSSLNSSELATSLLTLEMQRLIKVMPGKIISIIR